MIHLEEKLKQQAFIRIHKSHIISIGKIRSYSPDEIIMINGDQLLHRDENLLFIRARNRMRAKKKVRTS